MADTETIAVAAEDQRGKTDPVARFIEQMGLVAQLENRPRIAGRLLGLLLVEADTAFNLRELAERLRVSRASISTNARSLAEIGIIQRVAVPGDRQDYYQLSPDPFRMLVTGVLQKMTLAQQLVAKSADEFPAERAGVKRRIEQLANHYRIAAETIVEIHRRCGEVSSQSNPGANPS